MPASRIANAAAVRGRIAAGPNAGNRLSRFGGDQIDGDSLEAMASPRCATVAGFNCHANVSIGAWDRERLERLLRYAARPALALERLSKLPDGRLIYRLKRPWHDGTTDIIFEPQDFIAKLAAPVPGPRSHLIRYHGVLGPAAKWRPLVIPSQPIVGKAENPAPASLDHYLECSPTTSSRAQKRNHTWAQLMMRVFAIDVLECENCGGRLKILAAIHPPETTRKILDCLELPSRAPPLAPAVSEPFPDYY